MQTHQPTLCVPPSTAPSSYPTHTHTHTHHRYQAHAPLLAKVILPLSFVFAAHIIPVENGFPTRAAGAPINWACIIIMWLAAAAGAAGLWLRRDEQGHRRRKGELMLFVALVVICVDLNTAPFAEQVRL